MLEQEVRLQSKPQALSHCGYPALVVVVATATSVRDKAVNRDDDEKRGEASCRRIRRGCDSHGSHPGGRTESRVFLVDYLSLIP